MKCAPKLSIMSILWDAYMTLCITILPTPITHIMERSFRFAGTIGNILLGQFYLLLEFWNNSRLGKTIQGLMDYVWLTLYDVCNPGGSRHRLSSNEETREKVMFMKEILKRDEILTEIFEEISKNVLLETPRREFECTQNLRSPRNATIMKDTPIIFQEISKNILMETPSPSKELRIRETVITPGNVTIVKDSPRNQTDCNIFHNEWDRPPDTVNIDCWDQDWDQDQWKGEEESTRIEGRRSSQDMEEQWKGWCGHRQRKHIEGKRMDKEHSENIKEHIENRRRHSLFMMRSPGSKKEIFKYVESRRKMVKHGVDVFQRLITCICICVLACFLTIFTLFIYSDVGLFDEMVRPCLFSITVIVSCLFFW